MATKSKFTAIPYTDRMKNHRYKHFYDVHSVPCDMPVDIQEVNQSDNRVLRKTEYRSVDKSVLSNFKVSDFCLENIIAVGATELNPSYLMRDGLSASDNIESQLNNLENNSKTN